MSTQSDFVAKVGPMFVKYGKGQYGFKIVSFAIAQACLESGYGTSYDARNRNNLLGIGPHRNFASWEDSVKGYYTITSLGKSSAARNATSLDQYYRAFVSSGYLGGSGQSAYYANIKSIINAYGLSKYDSMSSSGGGANTGSSNTSSIVDDFVNKALSYNGKDARYWSSTHGKYYYPKAWCAGFVCGVANEVGILGKVIDFSLGAHVCAHSVIHHGGQWHDRGSYTPRRGDLVNFVWHGGSFADHIGIVVSYSNGKINTIEGNTSGASGYGSGGYVAQKVRPYNNTILGFGTPNWDLVGGAGSGSSSGGAGGLVLGDLYQEKNTRKDAILREAAYLDKDYKPTATQTNVKLSLINYTDLFTAFWNAGKPLISSIAGSGSGTGTGDSDYSKLDSKVRTIVQFFVGKGLNNAAACGICGNIKSESNFNTACVGDHGTSFGICQWHLGRGEAMKSMAGSNWANNLTGQLNYLWHELSTSYSSVLSGLRGVPNTEAGARQAADIFVRKFEVPANVNQQSQIRQEQAAGYFRQITTIATKSSTGTGGNFSSIDTYGLSSARSKILAAALEQLAAGTPYVWGGEVPGRNGGLDCSGLCQYCYKKAGISIPHQSSAILNAAPRRLPVSQAKPGDILWMPGHVGIYIGDGKTIEALGGGSRNGWHNKGGPVSQSTPKKFKTCCQWNI